jgi:phosphodiester glycosidase/flagellar hook capping protein FlgD
MRFSLLFALLVGVLLLAAPAFAQTPVILMPNVTFQKEVDFTPHGPVVVDVITAPPPVADYAIQPVLGGGTTVGATETVPQLETDVSSTATVAGINGDFYNATNGNLNGIYIQAGTIEHWSSSNRSSLGFDSAGTLHVERFATLGTWHGSGQRRPLNGMNQLPTKGQVVVFTPAWGPTTPVVANSSEVVLEPFPAAAPNTDLPGTATAYASGGGTPIPADGAVLMSVGSISAKLPTVQGDCPLGSTVTLRFILPSDWQSIVDAIGGGPVLVKSGKAVFDSGEDFISDQLTERDARAAVGQLSDGRVILVAVDGNQPGYSAGMTTYELAQEMVQLGAVTAGAVAFGSGVTAAFNGQLLNQPNSAATAQPVREALLVQYFGVYAYPPPVPVITQSTYGAGEQLSYKLVLPSTVTASVIAPDGTTYPVDSGTRAPGVYHFTWSSFGTQGTWHWNVHATDNLGRQSTADQPFSYNLTLSGLKVPTIDALSSGVPVSFTLSQPATVTLQIEKLGGAIVRTLPSQSAPTGAQTITWDATLDGQTKAYTGTYVMRVTATNSIGTMSLTAPFTLR